MTQYEEYLIVTTDWELTPGDRLQLRRLIMDLNSQAGFRIISVEHGRNPSSAVILDHHVIHSDGRLDVICSCGQHFYMNPGLNDQARAQRGSDAIEQWVAHYNENDSAQHSTEQGDKT